MLRGHDPWGRSHRAGLRQLLCQLLRRIGRDIQELMKSRSRITAACGLTILVGVLGVLCFSPGVRADGFLAHLNERVDEILQQDEDGLIEVAVSIPLTPVYRNINTFERSTLVEIVDGQVVRSELNGEEATRADFAASNAEFRTKLVADAEATRDKAEQAWRSAVESLRDPQLASILDSQPSGYGARTRHLRLTPAEVQALQDKSADSGLRIEAVQRTKEQSMASALSAVGLTSGGGAYTGEGVGIWQHESGQPDSSNPNIDSSRFSSAQTSVPIGGHATHMTAIIQAAATGSTVVWSQNAFGQQNFESFPDWVMIGSGAIGAVSASNPSFPYTSDVGNLDDFVVQSRYLVNRGSGNASNPSGLMVVGPALGHNVLAVGAVDQVASPDQIAFFSGYGQPAWAGPKPEVVAPGVGLNFPGLTTHGTGTSPATSLLSGLAAVIAEAYFETQFEPALLKILLMAAATHVEGVGVNPPDVMAFREGAGMPSFENIDDLNASAIAHNISSAATWSPNYSRGFGRNLVAGRTYRIGIAWLNGGSYALQNGGAMGSRWELRITPPSGGGSMVVINEPNRSFQLTEYTAPVSGVFTIEARRTQLSDTNTPVSIGITVVEK